MCHATMISQTQRYIVGSKCMCLCVTSLDQQSWALKALRNAMLVLKEIKYFFFFFRLELKELKIKLSREVFFFFFFFLNNNSASSCCMIVCSSVSLTISICYPLSQKGLRSLWEDHEIAGESIPMGHLINLLFLTCSHCRASILSYSYCSESILTYT